MCEQLILIGLMYNFHNNLAICKLMYKFKLLITRWPRKNMLSLEYISCTSKYVYPRGINPICKNNCQSNLKEIASW